MSEGLGVDKVSKISSDLEMVRNNMTVFSEILTELNPSGGGAPEDLELLQELYKSCKEMQLRVAQLLATPTTDELTVDMLQINDDMNDLFDRYDRKTAAYLARGQLAQDVTEPSLNLIDLGADVATATTNLGAMNLDKDKKEKEKEAKGQSGDDFDQFVASRSSNSDNGAKKTAFDQSFGANPSLTEEEIINGHRETDFEEMEAWLKANPGAEASLTSIPPPLENYLSQRNQQQNK